MDIASITQLIGSLGFPIVACVAMYFRMEKQDERHLEEMTKVTDALNNNTRAVEQLSALINAKGDDLK